MYGALTSVMIAAGEPAQTQEWEMEFLGARFTMGTFSETIWGATIMLACYCLLFGTFKFLFFILKRPFPAKNSLAYFFIFGLTLSLSVSISRIVVSLCL